jgi:hypothetical protein
MQCPLPPTHSHVHARVGAGYQPDTSRRAGERAHASESWVHNSLDSFVVKKLYIKHLKEQRRSKGAPDPVYSSMLVAALIVAAVIPMAVVHIPVPRTIGTGMLAEAPGSADPHYYNKTFTPLEVFSHALSNMSAYGVMSHYWSTGEVRQALSHPAICNPRTSLPHLTVLSSPPPPRSIVKVVNWDTIIDYYVDGEETPSISLMEDMACGQGFPKAKFGTFNGNGAPWTGETPPGVTGTPFLSFTLCVCVCVSLSLSLPLCH